jgi:hypothetical protein
MKQENNFILLMKAVVYLTMFGIGAYLVIKNLS